MRKLKVEVQRPDLIDNQVVAACNVRSMDASLRPIIFMKVDCILGRILIPFSALHTTVPQLHKLIDWAKNGHRWLLRLLCYMASFHKFIYLFDMCENRNIQQFYDDVSNEKTKRTRYVQRRQAVPCVHFLYNPTQPNQ